VRARVAAATVGVAALLVALPVARRTTLADHVRSRPVANEPATPGRFVRRTYTDGDVVYQYQVFFPHDFDPKLSWPVIVALHGSGEKGEDGEKQVHTGLANVVRDRANDFPAIVIFPQVPRAGQVWSHAAPMARLIDAAVREVGGDPKRVYLTGLSFGGVLAYLVVRERPDLFAALVQISAPLIVQPGNRSTRLSPVAAASDEASVLRGIPVWIFQGARDPNVPVTATHDVVYGLKSAGVSVKYTEYPDESHEIWDRAYREPDLWRWLFERRRSS
jgi:predicted peptidase